MMPTYLMHKDEPVLEVDNYACVIHNYSMLPYALRYEGVDYDDVMHNWPTTRVTPIGRTNAKKIFAACRIPAHDSSRLSEMCHYASLTDCYWMKFEGETITWDDVNLFRAVFNETLIQTALGGSEGRIKPGQRLHSPELTVQGTAAKAWINGDDGIYLCKVGKIEVPAGRILDDLMYPHVTYEYCSDDELSEIITPERAEKINAQNEKVVKCKCMTSENISIVTWEDYAIYCEHNGLNPYKEVEDRFPLEMARMRYADYLLGNDDRHWTNYGFFMDNDTGEITGMHPLMDHDHAFCNDTIISQTFEEDITLEEGALRSLPVLLEHGEKIGLTMGKPEELPDDLWRAVKEREERLRSLWYMCENLSGE